ncbi:MAG: DinB family protein [Planctomycetota bacterium]
MSNATQTDRIVERAVGTLEFSRGFLMGLIEDMSPEQMRHAPPGARNHALWVLGHMASADVFFLASLGVSMPELPEGWHEQFGGDSMPTADGDYPSDDEVVRIATTTREALLNWWKGLSDADLDTPLPQDLQMFAATYAQLPFSTAWHEAFHTGQIAVNRQSLGLPRLIDRMKESAASQD